jgi:23S rRNA pseudouridine1911/1915/1917 synthase
VGDNRVLLVPEGLEGDRVDVAVARLLGLSRTKITDLIEAGHVLIDALPVGKSDRVHSGAMLEVRLPDAAEGLTIVPQTVEGVDIVFDDDHIVVVDKPVGVAAHPSLGWDGPSVLGHLAGGGFRVSTSGVPERQGIVQRLDVGTSGLMVVAKSELAYTILKRAFRSRAVDKTYHALVQGHPDPFTGTIEAPIGPSITHYDTLEAFVGTTLLELSLETGRTHQIRVHLAALKHPCAGDLTYGADPKLAAKLGLQRQWLHAVRLGFLHPVTSEPLVFSSPYPDDLRHALDIVRTT